MQLALTILGLILACVAIWLGLRHKKTTDRRLKSIESRLEGVEKNVGPIRHIRRQVGGKHEKKSG